MIVPFEFFKVAALNLHKYAHSTYWYANEVSSGKITAERR